MPAYMIALNRGVHDRKKLEEYWKAAGPTFESVGAKRLAIYTPLTPLELIMPLEGAVVIEFPDLATARGWYEVRPIKRHDSTGSARRMLSYSLLMAVLSPQKIVCRTSSPGSLKSSHVRSKATR